MREKTIEHRPAKKMKEKSLGKASPLTDPALPSNIINKKEEYKAEEV